MENNLLKEAIADAKAVRQTALANAKVAMEEAFTEKYTKMFSDKLREDVAESGMTSEVNPAAHAEPDADNINAQEIDELIKELEAEAGNEQPVDGQVPPAPAPAPMAPPVDGQVPPAPMAPPVDGQVPPAPMAPMAPPAMPQAPMAPPVDGQVPPAPAPTDGQVPPMPPSDVPPAPETDEEINLDELLQTLKEEIEEEEKEEKEEDVKKIDEKLTSSGIATSDNKKPAASAFGSTKPSPEMPKTDNAKVTAKDPSEAKRPNEAKNATSTNLSTPSLGGSSGPLLKAPRPNSKGEFENTSKLNEENSKLKQQLSEAYETITYVKGQLNEINLLNAKLLYTNKLFKEYGMNNDQKMRIVEMFDLSKNVREVKLTYANIAESLNFGGTDVKKKAVPASVQSITEGLASKPVGSTKPAATQIITESAGMVAKFQKLAGIKSKTAGK